jgi:uncharacterized protein (UPF0548 family)
VLRVRRPSPAVVLHLLSEAQSSPFTYPEVGATKSEPFPAGYRHDAYAIDLGTRETTFERAVEALRAWGAQIAAGIEIVPNGAHVAEGETVILVIRTAGFWAIAPCRVVYVVEQPDHFAFAYGTLPGHPEQGEAAFAINRSETGAVSFHVTSFSRTVDPLARLGAPITRRIQQRVTRRYLSALAEATIEAP